MVSENGLLRMASRLTAYVDKYVTLAGAEKKEEVLELFDKIQRLFPYWAIATCPIMHPEIKYASKNCNLFFDIDEKSEVNHSAEEFFRKIHFADQQDVQHCFEFAHNFLQTIPAELHEQYRCVFHYRFMKDKTQHVYLYDEKAVLNLKGSGNLYYSLFRNITDERVFTGVRVEIFRHENSISKIAEHKPSLERNTLSKREGELITLFKQGLSTKEIAGYLKISHNTVRNIKSKMFEKYNVNNTIELLNMTA